MIKTSLLSTRQPGLRICITSVRISPDGYGSFFSVYYIIKRIRTQLFTLLRIRLSKIMQIYPDQQPDAGNKIFSVFSYEAFLSLPQLTYIG